MREQKQKASATTEQDTVADAPAASSATVVADDTDALLDEIDEVLESNAEQFVKQYVQKGGE